MWMDGDKKTLAARRCTMQQLINIICTVASEHRYEPPN